MLAGPASPATPPPRFHAQGGGMQGIIAAAGLLHLKSLGLRNTFDAVYGASAGAISAAYFLSGQDQGINV